MGSSLELAATWAYNDAVCQRTRQIVLSAQDPAGNACEQGWARDRTGNAEGRSWAREVAASHMNALQSAARAQTLVDLSESSHESAESEEPECSEPEETEGSDSKESSTSYSDMPGLVENYGLGPTAQ